MVARTPWIRKLVLLGILVGQGCAHRGAGTEPNAAAGTATAPGEEASEDPTAALAALFETPAPAGMFSEVQGRVSEWTPVTPGTAEVGVKVVRPEGLWGELFSDAVARRAGLVTVSEALGCTAQEVGAYVLEHGEMPDRALVRFLGSRCGSAAVNVSPRFLAGEVPEEAEDAEVLEKWRENATKLFDAGLGSGQRLVGTWYGRQGNQAVLALVSGERRVHVEPFSRIPGEDGLIHVRGELLTPAAKLEAAIGIGPIGLAECEVDATIALPRFAFACRPDSRDEAAWIEVMAGAPNRFLGTNVLHTLVYPSGTPPPAFRRNQLKLAPAEGPLVPAFLDLVNQIRTTASMPPMSLAREQSRTATQAAPYFFASILGHLPLAVADVVGLGLFLGPEVSGMVQNGSFAAGWVPGQGDPLALLSSMLESLAARRVLFDPVQTVLAVGPLEPKDTDVTAVVLSGYDLFEEAEPATLRQQVLETLTRARAAAGTPAPSPLVELDPDLEAACQALIRGRATPDEALGRAAEATVQATQGDARSWLVETESLDEIPFPPQLLQANPLLISVAVGVYRPDESGFARYIVLFGFSTGGKRAA